MICFNILKTTMHGYKITTANIFSRKSAKLKIAFNTASKTLTNSQIMHFPIYIIKFKPRTFFIEIKVSLESDINLNSINLIFIFLPFLRLICLKIATIFCMVITNKTTLKNIVEKYHIIKKSILTTSIINTLLNKSSLPNHIATSFVVNK